jgi:prefoldin beta subunit
MSNNNALPEAEIRLINEIQQDLQRTNMARSKLHVQLSENEIVLVELNHVRVSNADGASSSHGSVYKLVGPLLVKQDLDEAKANVRKRIEFIRGELKRLEAKAAEDQAKIAAQNKKLVEIQRDMAERVQRQQQAAQQQAIAAATAAAGKPQ